MTHLNFSCNERRRGKNSHQKTGGGVMATQRRVFLKPDGIMKALESFRRLVRPAKELKAQTWHLKWGKCHVCNFIRNRPDVEENPFKCV